MPSLYDLAPEFLQLLEVIEQAEADEIDVDLAVIEAFEQIAGDVDNKVVSIVKLYRTVSAESVAAKAEADRFAQMAKTKANRAESLKGLLSWVVHTLYRDEFSHNLYPLKMQKNGGKDPLILDEIDPSTLPVEYLKEVKPAIDNSKVYKALKAGTELDWAHLGQRGTSLRGL